MKNKILLFILTLSLVIGIFSVTCFADTTNGIFFKGDSFTFNDKIVYSFGYYYEFYFDFSYIREGNLIYAEGMVIEDNGEYDYQIAYLTHEGTYDIVYNGRWITDSAKTITIVSDVVDFSNTDVYSYNALSFIYQNTYDGSVRYPIYDNLRELIVKYVFNDKPLYYEEEISVSLVCLVFSLVVFATPLLVILWLSRWITTLGRGVF